MSLDGTKKASIANDSIVSSRLRNQRLIGDPFSTAEDVVRTLTAIQSQDFSGAKWAIAQRLNGATDLHINTLFNEGKILRTHVMRPTWHFVTPADIRWMQMLTAPRVEAASAYAFRKLELDSTVFRRSKTVIVKELRDGRQLTRDEIGKALATAGIEASGVRLAYVLIRFELDALICSGARRANQFTYALLDERVPPCKSFSRDEALVNLTRRYFTSHGPALLSDFTWWSGLTMIDAKAGVDLAGDDLNHENINGKTYWFGNSETNPHVRRVRLRGTDTTIHLLPNYDEYVIAYRDRTCFMDPQVEKSLRQNVHIVATNPIIRNGKAIGVWRREIEKDQVIITTKFAKKLNRSGQRSLRRAATRFARFLELDRFHLIVNE